MRKVRDMFIKKYLNDTYFNLLLDNYEIEYLKSFNEEHFIAVYELLKKYNFYFIDDIILNYLEIFGLSLDDIKMKITEMKNKYGDNFIYIIGQNLSLLNNYFDV